MTRGLVVYTAISDDYDYLRIVPRALRGISCVCFKSNGPYGVFNGWQVRPFPNDIAEPTRRCRDVKINSHVYFPEYRCSLWVDSSIQMTDAVAELLIAMLASGEPFASLVHPERCCIYDEAVVCAAERRDDPVVINKQIAFLRFQGYPKDAGLIATGVLFRLHHEPAVVDAMTMWSDLLTRFSKRDQLSLNYVLWKTGLPFEPIPTNARGISPAFELGLHRADRDHRLTAFLQAHAYGNPVYRFLLWLLRLQSWVASRAKKLVTRGFWNR